VVAAIDDRARTLAISRPGWDGHTEPAGFPANAAAAVDALDRADVAQAVVVGHSLGAAVAAWTASAYPDRVSALVLLAPAANADSLVPLDRLLAVPIIGDILGAASLAAAGGTLATAPGRRLVSGTLGVDASELGRWSGRLLRPGFWRSFAFEQRMLLRELPQLEERLGQIASPTTIVAGTADRIVPVRSARRLADQIPKARLVELPGAHHLVHHERAAEVAELLVSAARADGRRG
jgi:pimeloyl-ACP methyl ester carboxylesterase